MPPANPIAEATGATFGGVANHQQFPTPSAARVGDTYLAFIVQAPGTSHVDATNPANAGWTELAELELTNATVIIARRPVADGDPAALDIFVTNAGGWILSALLVYRQLDNAAAVVGASGSNIAATTNFTCPAQTLTHYSDLYIGIVGITSAGVAVTPPAGTSEKHEHTLAARELELFVFHAEATGSTGAKTATTAANQSGVAASIALAAVPVVVAPSMIADVAGAIGLPAVGV